MTVADCVLTADWVVPVSSPPFSNGWVAVTGGSIAALGQGPPPPSNQVKNYQGNVLIPGLINAHAHLGCSFLEKQARGLGFLDWLSGNITPQVIDAYLGPEAANKRSFVEAHAQRAVLAMANSGVTTVVDSFFDSVGFDALCAAGLRGIFCREYFGSRDEDLARYVAAMKDRTTQDAQRFSRDNLSFGLAPHALYTCPRDVLVEVFGMAKDKNLPVSIHVAESAEEFAFFTEGRGPMVELFAPGEKKERYEFGKTPIKMMHDLGLLGPGVILVHMVHVNEEDLDLVAQSGAGVVHCPGSNATLSVGTAPVAQMLKRGIPLAIGTDSWASNLSMNLFDEMRLALTNQNVQASADPLDAKSVLTMATLGAAEVCGMGHEIGSLEVGKKADMAVVSVPDSRCQKIDGDNIFEHLMAEECSLVSSWISGKRQR